MTSVHLTEEVINIKTSITHSLLQGENQHTIICNDCQYMSISTEPFAVVLFITI